MSAREYILKDQEFCPGCGQGGSGLWLVEHSCGCQATHPERPEWDCDQPEGHEGDHIAVLGSHEGTGEYEFVRWAP